VNIAFTTIGCPKNEVDTDTMRAALVSAGHTVTDDTDAADLVVVNTCAFIRTATETSIETILDLLDSENTAGHTGEDERSTRLRQVVVTGCMVNRYGDDLAAEIPEVAAFVPIADEASIVSVVAELDEGGQPAVSPAAIPEAACEGTTRTVDAPYTYVKIADGCDRSCSYCTIPGIRGPYRSRPADDIVSEVGALAERGVREFILIAQDTGRYGCDLPAGTPDATLPDLLRRLDGIPGVQRLRIMYLQPEGLTDRLLDCMAGLQHVVPYLDIPLQHSERRILRLMHRVGDGDEYARLIAHARECVPGLVVRTTLIAGFPSETADEFAALLDWVRRVDFDYVGVFAYSPEDGTVAATLPGQLSDELRNSRAQQLRDAADRLGWERAAQSIGDTVSVLIEGYDAEEGCALGRTPHAAPEIDGIVRLQGDPSDYVVGQTVDVRIIDTILYDAFGEAL
jgi:ribosomal protein S12 methylthiotransferase